MSDWVQGAVAEGRERAWSSDQVRSVLAAQRGTSFLWSPLWLMAGIAVYFALPREPSPLAFVLIVVITALLLFGVRLRRSHAARILLLILVGFCLIKARTEWVSAPTLRAATGEVELSGIIEDFEWRSPKQAVAILRLVKMTGAGVTLMPARARVTMTGTTPLRPGQLIRTKARLFPLPTPMVPGGYDHGRSLWFQGIGATGRLFSDMTVVGTDPSLLLVFRAGLEDLRNVIGQRIRAVLPPERSGVGEAMITGERGTIPNSVNDSLQASGLAHILSISGLHMSLVAGLTFWLVRATLALSSTLANAYPIKKWAALAGLVIGLVYLLLASASVATQRSYIMLAVMFIAILADRPALSMRNLAIAALMILVFSPESALAAGLQMSFLAVMGLLAVHEAWATWLARRDEADQSILRRGASLVFRALCMAVLTSVAAGGLSSIAAAYHFGRLAPYSLIANLLAMPVMSILVMPFALFSVLVMPFGLEEMPLRVMDAGLVLVQAISDWVVSLPGAEGNIPTLSSGPALLLTLAAVMLCLTRGPVRFVALPLSLMALLATSTVRRPDIYVDTAAKTVAIRNDGGKLVPADPRRGRFSVSQWLRVDGDGATPAEAARRSGWACKASICRAIVKDKQVLYLPQEKPAMAIPCAEADILIAAFPLRGRCHAVPLRIDRFSVWREGAHALNVDGSTVRLETARGLQGVRPWTVVPEPRRKDTSR